MNLTPQDLALWREQAKRDAPLLRRAAIAAFWAEAAAVLGRLWRRAAAQPRRPARA